MSKVTILYFLVLKHPEESREVTPVTVPALPKTMLACRKERTLLLIGLLALVLFGNVEYQ